MCELPTHAHDGCRCCANPVKRCFWAQLCRHEDPHPHSGGGGTRGGAARLISREEVQGEVLPPPPQQPADGGSGAVASGLVKGLSGEGEAGDGAEAAEMMSGADADAWFQDCLRQALAD